MKYNKSHVYRTSVIPDIKNLRIIETFQWEETLGMLESNHNVTLALSHVPENLV